MLLYLDCWKSKPTKQSCYSFDYNDSIISENREFTLFFQKLGTKGVLLKNGTILRKIRRADYQASYYEFPAAFFTFKERTYLIHCPIEYCRLDIEDAETGEILSNKIERETVDVFYSGLLVSQDNKYLLSNGWMWHPVDCINLFNLEKCMDDFKLLDDSVVIPTEHSVVNFGSFIDNNRVWVTEILFDGNERFGVWEIDSNEMSSFLEVFGEYENIYTIEDRKSLKSYEYSIIIDLLMPK